MESSSGNPVIELGAGRLPNCPGSFRFVKLKISFGRARR